MDQPPDSPRRSDDKDDALWIVLLVVVGLMGFGGPLLGLLLFLFFH
ncbi:MAG: hypothetical protein AAF710_05100 [Planctomycetota bacterium]